MNNNILKLLIQSLSDKNLVKKFTKLLQMEENLDLQQFFPDLNLTKSIKVFISSIYPRTKNCIAQVKFPFKDNQSLVHSGGKAVGMRLDLYNPGKPFVRCQCTKKKIICIFVRVGSISAVLSIGGVLI